MTARYDLLINSIITTDLTVLRLFLFAFGAVIAYPVLGWLHVTIRRPMQYLYLASMLALFVFTTVFSAR